MTDIFDCIGYLKLQGFIVANSYRLNPAYKLVDVLDKLTIASGKPVSEKEFQRLLNNNNIAK